MKFILFNTINKYKISILWTISIMIFLVGVIVAQFKPFSDKGSDILMWFSFNAALLAMTFSAMKKRKQYKIILCISGMLYITYKVVFQFI